MREKEIEKMLVNAVKIHGGLALKFVSPNFNGMPDRLILLPFGKIAFAEMKAPGRKMRSIQIKRDVYKRQLIGITDMEKLMGRKIFKELLGDYIIKRCV